MGISDCLPTYERASSNFKPRLERREKRTYRCQPVILPRIGAINIIFFDLYAAKAMPNLTPNLTFSRSPVQVECVQVSSP